MNIFFKSSPGFSLQTALDELPLVPFVRWEHVDAVMDTEDRHLIGVLEVLQ